MVLLAGLLCALGMPAARAAGTGLLRIAHLSPDAPAVDVTVTPVSTGAGTVAVPALGYGSVSDYRSVPAGTYTVGIRGAGAGPGSPPALSTTVRIGSGTARTVAVAGSFADLRLAVLDDDLTPPPPGAARIRVVAAAATAPTVDVSLTGAGPVAAGLAFGRAGGWTDVPAGTTALTVTPAGGAATALPLALAAGSVHSVLLLDRPGGGLTVRPVLDAAGPAAVPAGSVPAGREGDAPPSGRLSAIAAIVAASAALGLLLTTRRGRALVRRAAGR